MWQVAAAGDRALLVTISRTIDPAVLGEVLALDRAILDRRPPGLISTVTAYGSLLCHYDPAVSDGARLAREIRTFEGRLDATVPTGSVVEVPTRYDGPDLTDVAAKVNLTAAEVIELHAGRDYLVYCVGFAPGFTYCGVLDDALVLPRLASPRTYAVESPGGWNLIGRTDMRLFDPAADPPARFKPGDRLRFVPVE